MGKKMLLVSRILLLILSVSSLSMNIVRISKAQENHDIAVINVTPPRIPVMSGELVTITVVVGNQGTEIETFDVTLYHDSVTIETKTVTDLAAGQNATLVFAWDTTDTIEEIYASTYKEKTYDINAIATLISDTDQADNTASAQMTIISQYIGVIPQRTVDFAITSGMNYTVAIYTDYNGSDIWSWQFTLTYNPNFLEGIEVRNGDLITTVKHSNAVFRAGEFNNTIGELRLTGAYFEYIDTYDTTTGPGTLAYVTFKTKGLGESNITLIETQTYLFGPGANVIIDDITPSINHILYGYFRNTVIVIHDISIISVTPSTTSVAVGEAVNITVVVENQGTVAEMFDVNVYYNYDSRFPTTNLIGTETVLSLATKANKTSVFAWNTTNTKPGDCTITAVVSKVNGETDLADNTLLSDQLVTVRAHVATPLPINEIIIGVVVLVAVIVVIALVRRRRRKPIREED